MRNPLRHSLTFVITFAALTTSLPAGSVSEHEALDTLLTRYDREAEGGERDRLAARIDSIAHQKYATVSRLYWHVDLASAKAAAREAGRPILHLRMLGRLDEDLSCANSRLFRATLYANREVSAFLRERFVLYWSSERPVPRVTIDYGDGRTLQHTVTGNSAHYVMDEDGHVLDALPGLYAPLAFRRELEGSLALAARVRHTSASERAERLADHHQRQVTTAERDWQRLAAVPGIAELRRLIDERAETALVAAQRRAFAKSAVELRVVRAITKDLAPEAPPVAEATELEIWTMAGTMLYGDAALDAASRRLTERLHNAARGSSGYGRPELDAMVARLQRTIVADTALNQLRLRPQISREIVRRAGRIDFDTLNAWIYDQVFRTPRHDPWLGLLQRDVFTGLPAHR